jgi:hypothetical protein
MRFESSILLMLGFAPLALAQSKLPAASGTEFMGAPYSAAFAATQTTGNLPSAPEAQHQVAIDGGELVQAQLPFPATYLIQFGFAEMDSATGEGSGDATPAPPEAETAHHVSALMTRLDTGSPGRPTAFSRCTGIFTRPTRAEQPDRRF